MSARCPAASLPFAGGHVTDRRQHWETVYVTRQPTDVSWYQRDPQQSFDLITSLAPDRSSSIIDVGSGASTLVDQLIAAGYRRITLLDISETALQHTRARLGSRAEDIDWKVADVLAASFPKETYDVWHDRAVFHFLVNPEDRRKYIHQVRCAVRQNGLVVIATFAADGPSRCSGLDVARYSAADLATVFGSDFTPIATVREEHVTPAAVLQPFTYAGFRFNPRLV